MTKLEIAGVNLFETRKTAKRYIDISDALIADSGIEAQKEFTKKLMDLFWKKQESLDGEYAEYKITEEELLNLSKIVAFNF